MSEDKELELFDKWVDALESGDYDQTRGTLTEYNYYTEKQAYCCLGVLCSISDCVSPVLETTEIPGKFGQRKDVPIGYTTNSIDTEFLCESYLPDADSKLFEFIRRGWEDIATEVPEVSEATTLQSALANLNDSGADFKEVASTLRRLRPHFESFLYAYNTAG